MKNEAPEAKSIIEQFAAFYGLKPKNMRKYDIHTATRQKSIAQAGKATVNFWQGNDGKWFMSYDGGMVAAYQIALNVLHNKVIQTQMGVNL